MARQKEIRGEPEFIEQVVKINRVAKVAKGGRRFGFSVLVVAGDGKGRVGYGLGKANQVSEAIGKGLALAKKNLVAIPMKGTTIPYAVTGKFGAAKVVMRPASQGTGVRAGGAVRAVMESAGVGDVLTKSVGSSNPLNLVRATMKALDESKRMGERSLLRTEKQSEIAN
jgi:small subunit ribosomal protein S5